jgi:hypothetical protein
MPRQWIELIVAACASVKFDGRAKQNDKYVIITSQRLPFDDAPDYSSRGRRVCSAQDLARGPFEILEDCRMGPRALPYHLARALSVGRCVDQVQPHR